MCEPITMGILAVASAASGMYSQNRAAQAQADAAYETAQFDMQALQEQTKENNAATRLEQFERMRQAIRMQGTMKVGMGESGLTGVTPLRLLRGEESGADYDMSIMESNRQSASKQNARETKKVVSTATNRQTEAKNNSVGLLAGGLQIANAGVGGYVKGAEFKKAIKG